jgi:hypothetical protein
MSSKTRTHTASPATKQTGSARTLRSVPDQAAAATARTDAEDKLWQALHANPNSTAADLSVAAGIGKSTAPRILAKWAEEGSVTRIAGIAQGGRRAADLWVITAADTTQNDPAPAEAAVADGHDVTGIAEAESNAPGVPVAGDGTESNSTNPRGTQPVGADPVDTGSAVAQDDGTPGTADDATSTEEAGSVGLDAEPASADCAAINHDQATARGAAEAAGEKTPRLPSGALQGMVEDFLREHPAEAFGPVAIAKALGGKSSGAVSNALDKLADHGVAVKTSDKPKRFALDPAQQAAALTSTN